MSKTSEIESKIKLWLTSVLQEEKLSDMTVKIVGNTEKGDGYLGDIVFVDVFGITENRSTKEYNLVLKCSKNSESLRSQSPVKDVFLNEMWIYEQVLPTFAKFEQERGVENYFNSIPKYYGRFIGDLMEVVVFENLKKLGYNLWDKKKLLTRNHINMVIKNYAQLHAISVAMKDQEPEQFENVLKSLDDVFAKFNVGSPNDSWPIFAGSVEEVYNILQNDLDESILQKWIQLKPKVKDVLTGFDKSCRLKVVIHGDCWNNNFMFLNENNDNNMPKKVAILDWQMSQYATPILDVSYFLFACISEEDIMDMDTILKYYYNHFADHLVKLGSQPTILYPFEEFLDDWKKYAKFGLVISSFTHKMCSAHKDEVGDIAETANEGKSFVTSFVYDIKDTDSYKKRVRHIVKYVVEHDLV